MTQKTAVRIQRVGPDAEALALLSVGNLVTTDIAPERTIFIGATSGGELIGLIGLEVLGMIGLVRSMVVNPSRRGEGIAQRLYHELEENARILGLLDLYALTETAEGFFLRAGYSRVDRLSAPAAIANTQQFSALCPASAAILHRSLAKASQ